LKNNRLKIACNAISGGYEGASIDQKEMALKLKFRA
jgi:hypothetical protein